MLLFLKLYDGLPHLVSFAYIWAVFGFFWQVDPRYKIGIALLLRKDWVKVLNSSDK